VIAIEVRELLIVNLIRSTCRGSYQQWYGYDWTAQWRKLSFIRGPETALSLFALIATGKGSMTFGAKSFILIQAVLWFCPQYVLIGEVHFVGQQWQTFGVRVEDAPQVTGPAPYELEGFSRVELPEV
jgi:hypothetical protein